MGKNGARQFGAFVEPQGIYLVEYARERDGVSILRQHSDARQVVGLADAGERLAAVIQAEGAVGSHLSVAMRGFGSTCQIMLLPAASPSLIGPVVRREVARLHPDMDRPRVDFVMHGDVDRRKRPRPGTAHPPQEVLVGAAPEAALSDFGEELNAAGVRLDHLTVLPQVVQRLYRQAEAFPAPTACYLELPGGPLIAFFHDGQIRLVIEPPLSPDEDLLSRTEGIVEHLDRGKLYLRQKFRGAELGRLLVAAEPSQEAPLLEALRERLGYRVERFPSPAASTGALVSIGAVLDAESDRGLNLSPFAESAEAASEKRQRRNALMAGAAVVLLAVVWALFSVASVLKWSRQVETLNRTAKSRMAALEPMRTVAAQRQAYTQSVAYLEKVGAERAAAQAIIRGLARAKPPGLQLSSISMDNSAGQWTVGVAGAAFGESGADALLDIDRFFHGLPRQLGMHDLVLANLEDLPAAKFPAGMKFSLRFVSSGGPPQ